MYKFVNKWSRKLHRWGALLTAVPVLLVIVSGLLLQVKKQVSWVQPPTLKGTGTVPAVSWEQLLATAQLVPEAQIATWDDVVRLDVRPDRRLVKILAQNHWEVQVDLGTGKLLSATYRRSDWIESLHDGSFFSETAKLWVFLPNGLILLGLWITGVYLWYLPFYARQRQKRSSKTSTPKTTAEEKDR